MLLRLLLTYLAPYRSWLTAIVLLQLTSTAAMLLLPSINADIIENGVARGDTGYIARAGAVMLGVGATILLVAAGLEFSRSFSWGWMAAGVMPNLWPVWMADVMRCAAALPMEPARNVNSETMTATRRPCGRSAHWPESDPNLRVEARHGS